jgi:hypothetical protein
MTPTTGANTSNAHHSFIDKDGQRRFDKEAVESDFLTATAHLSASELRNRLKSSEVDRARGMYRLTALKEKVVCLEADLDEISKERDRYIYKYLYLFIYIYITCNNHIQIT